jgi:putative tryptophan/tyrosine transport system substrate-binding protein
MPAAAQVREGRFRVGVLEIGSWPIPQVVQELVKLGYVEGQNTTFEARSAKGEVERLPAFAAALVALKPDVILAVSTPPAMALKAAVRPFQLSSANSAEIQWASVWSRASPG